MLISPGQETYFIHLCTSAPHCVDLPDVQVLIVCSMNEFRLAMVVSLLGSSTSQLASATSLVAGGSAALERPPGRGLVPLRFLPASSWPAPRPAPRPGYITEPKGPPAGRPGPGRVCPAAHILPTPSTQVLKGRDDHHSAAGAVNLPPAASASAGGRRDPAAPCVLCPQRPSTRAAITARSRRWGQRSLVRRSPPPAPSPRLLAGAAAPAG